MDLNERLASALSEISETLQGVLDGDQDIDEIKATVALVHEAIKALQGWVE